MLRRTLRTVLLCTLLVPLAACDGPGGVKLGTDWSGSQVFVLSKMSGLTTVVGIDPQRHTAEPLAVVPTQSDDNQVLSPHITRLSDGRWVVTIPKTGSTPSTLYAINTRTHGLDLIGKLQSGHTLLPMGQTAAAVTAADTSKTGKASAVLYNPGNWHAGPTVALPLDTTLAAGSASGLCIGNVTDTTTLVAVVPLPSGPAAQTVHIKGFQAQSMSCDAGNPVLGGALPKAGNAGGTPTLKLTTQDHIDVLTTSTGTVAQVSSTPTTITAAIALPRSIELIEISRTDARVLHRATVNNLNTVQGMRQTPAGTWILTSDNTAVAVDLAEGTSTTFALPGDLLDAG
ncbi:hypothetical protein [Streptacidiphilus cavernicola]|uniref:Lipoprotein LpqB beta-propeller domain-containing protein n=1 Tax=Streptacidiphilus cavernicola TaxID=3342716 RepID=A0ABV6W226_9ACTN